MAVLRWLRAVFKQWIADVTGGVLIGALVLYSELSGITVPPKIYGVVVGFVLFQAMFLAWHEQERNALKAEADVTTLRRNAQFGLALGRLKLADPSDDHSVIQFKVFLKNHLPNNALRFMVESEVATFNGQTLDSSETFSMTWHGLGVSSEMFFLGQKFENVTFAERMEGTIEYCIRYGMAGDSVSYRMERKLALTLTKRPDDAIPVLQRWVVVSDSDVLVP